ncbi:hypothetical protein RF11_02522 [Thelohanellus kitauei]|uniref:Chloride channel CLIC-like protein 1 n=1 Tax=Thelohanellus kitauei TaxID=669202 RepID=A0A0C2MIA2_THEKT|nr:hypothetical protein RF11_02522 [Thelohanellus kitauei]
MHIKKTELAIHLSYACIILFGACMALSYFHSKSSLTFLIFLLFAQPVLVEWIRLYQNSIALKMSKYGKGVPMSCQDVNQMSYFDTLLLWVSNTFTLKSDACHQYYSNILVDPLTEISILEVRVVTIRQSQAHFADLWELFSTHRKVGQRVSNYSFIKLASSMATNNVYDDSSHHYFIGDCAFGFGNIDTIDGCEI